MNSTVVLGLLNSLVVGLAGWAIKRTIDNAVSRWTDRIEKTERDIVDERGKREALALKVDEKISVLHAEVDDVRENKMDREESMREAGRMRQTLETLLVGQSRIEGQLVAMAQKA